MTASTTPSRTQMHEGGLVADALAHLLATGAPIGRLEMEVADPVGVSVDSLLLHLRLAMEDRGLGEVPVSVRVSPVRCAACGVSAPPAAGDPFCAACGWPLPRRDGAAVRLRAVS